LLDRGFRRDHSARRDDGYDGWWWNERAGQCVRVFVRDRHYADLRAVDPDACGRAGGGGGDGFRDRDRDRDGRRDGDDRYADLVGRINADADNTLRRRGFQLVDKDDAHRGDGHERYYWRPWNEQCLVMRTQGGFVKDLRPVPRRACR
jgi:hypothetical protein